jgi:hypothetical protein
VRSQTARLNDRGGPHRTQQVICCDRVALRRYKRDQDVKALRRERDTFAISKQRMPIGVQMVRAKFVLTAGRQGAKLFEESIRKIAAFSKDFQPAPT